MEMTYYDLYVKNINPTVTAFAPDNVMHLGLDKSVRGMDSMPFGFRLGLITSSRKGLVYGFDLDGISQPLWPDYLNSTLAVGLFSQRFRDIVCRHLTGNEDIDWIRCLVSYRDEAREYFMLRFLTDPDVLDPDHSSYAPNSDYITIPTFRYEKISAVSIFPTNASHSEIPIRIYVRNDIRLDTLREQLTGMSFHKLTRIF